MVAQGMTCCDSSISQSGGMGGRQVGFVQGSAVIEHSVPTLALGAASQGLTRVPSGPTNVPQSLCVSGGGQCWSVTAEAGICAAADGAARRHRG